MALQWYSSFAMQSSCSGTNGTIPSSMQPFYQVIGNSNTDGSPFVVIVVFARPILLCPGPCILSLESADVVSQTEEANRV